MNGPVSATRPDLGPCWVWMAAKNSMGYANFSVSRKDRKWKLGHVFCYELFVGTVPVGKELDHLCRIPACVNWKHVEPVSHRINCLRGTSPSANNSKKTSCVNGHEFSVRNTYVDSLGSRHCRPCRAKVQRDRRKRLRVESVRRVAVSR
jgi:hypothetical protein